MPTLGRPAGYVCLGLFLCSLILINTGCGGAQATPADPNQAVDALKSVLEAWKSGETVESLGSRTPSIHVTDLDWQGGYKLIGYETAAEGRLVGYDMNYQVKLELKSPKGKAVKKTAVYTVSTSPQLLVLRQEG